MPPWIGPSPPWGVDRSCRGHSSLPITHAAMRKLALESPCGPARSENGSDGTGASLCGPVQPSGLNLGCASPARHQAETILAGAVKLPPQNPRKTHISKLTLNHRLHDGHAAIICKTALNINDGRQSRRLWRFPRGLRPRRGRRGLSGRPPMGGANCGRSAWRKPGQPPPDRCMGRA